MIRRYGDAPRNGTRYTHRPGAYAILPRDGKLLLTYQSAPHREFQLPGGGIDPGENPLQALHREVFEETGWRVANARRLGAFRRFVYMPEYDIEAEKVCHIYLARPVRQLAAPSEPDHIALWMDAQMAIQEIATDGDAAFIAALVD